MVWGFLTIFLIQLSLADVPRVGTGDDRLAPAAGEEKPGDYKEVKVTVPTQLPGTFLEVSKQCLAKDPTVCKESHIDKKQEPAPPAQPENAQAGDVKTTTSPITGADLYSAKPAIWNSALHSAALKGESIPDNADAAYNGVFANTSSETYGPSQESKTSTPMARALAAETEKFTQTTQQRAEQETTNQRQAAQAETEREQRAAQTAEQQKAALNNASAETLPQVSAQIASQNQQALAATNACNSAMENANNACSSANDVDINLPQDTSGGRNAMLIAETQCQKASQVFQGAANKCQSAISSCNGACSAAGRSCAVFSAYATSAMLKKDSADFCVTRSRITINQMDGNKSQGNTTAVGLNNNSSTTTDKDKKTSDKKKKYPYQEDESDTGSKPRNNLIANDSNENPNAVVKVSSVDKEKDAKDELKKIQTGSIDEGGYIRGGSAGVDFGKSPRERKSRLAGEESDKGKNSKAIQVETASVSAADLIANFKRRSVASKMGSDDVIDNNPNHDIFFGASRGHFIWQQKHAHLPTPSTPTFFYKENMMILIENGWQDE